MLSTLSIVDSEAKVHLCAEGVIYWVTGRGRKPCHCVEKSKEEEEGKTRTGTIFPKIQRFTFRNHYLISPQVRQEFVDESRNSIDD